MNRQCEVCGLVFEREQGYYVGAMYFSYLLGLPIVGVLVALIWLFTRWPVEKLLLAGFVMFLPFVPVVVIYARVLWVHLDRALDPDR